MKSFLQKCLAIIFMPQILLWPRKKHPRFYYQENGIWRFSFSVLWKQYISSVLCISTITLLIVGFCFLCYVAWSSDNPVGACTTFNNVNESYTITFKYNFPLSDETFKKLGDDKSWISDDLEYPRRYAIDYIGKLNAINWDWKRNHCINF